MSLKSKLQIESVGMFASLVFYTIVGTVCFGILAMVDFRLIHIGIVGILSLMTAYGLFKNRVWALWVVVALFFIVTTFSGYTLYYVFGQDILLNVCLIAYLVLTWIFTAYIVSRRRILES